jgi:hypothetical protein
VILAAQRSTNSFPSFPSRLTKRRLLHVAALLHIITAADDAEDIPVVWPSFWHVASNNRVWLVWSALEQITQPFGNHARPEQSSLPSALILEQGVVTRRPTFHLPPNRCAVRRLIRLMEVPGCSTATHFRLAFGAPSRSLRPRKTSIVVVKLFGNPPARWTRGL